MKSGTSTPISRWLTVRFLVLVVILDRVFQRDDVPVVVLVDEVDHAGQAGRLAGAGRPGDQQQAARPGDEPPDGLGHADLLEGQELARNAPQHHADVAALLEDGDAEAVAVGELDGEVGAALLLKLLLAAVGRDALHQGGGVVLVQHLGVEPAHTAVVADDRRLPDGDVQVARLELDDRGQQLVDQTVCLQPRNLLEPIGRRVVAEPASQRRRRIRARR